VGCAQALIRSARGAHAAPALFHNAAASARSNCSGSIGLLTKSVMRTTRSRHRLGASRPRGIEETGQYRRSALAAVPHDDKPAAVEHRLMNRERAPAGALFSR
jgi:hypothetical protein